jgi:hypothetical protein
MFHRGAGTASIAATKLYLVCWRSGSRRNEGREARERGGAAGVRFWGGRLGFTGRRPGKCGGNMEARTRYGERSMTLGSVYLSGCTAG